MTQRWEVDEIEWDGLRVEIRERLTVSARARRLVSYSELIEGMTA